MTNYEEQQQIAAVVEGLASETLLQFCPKCGLHTTFRSYPSPLRSITVFHCTHERASHPYLTPGDNAPRMIKCSYVFERYNKL